MAVSWLVLEQLIKGIGHMVFPDTGYFKTPRLILCIPWGPKLQSI